MDGNPDFLLVVDWNRLTSPGDSLRLPCGSIGTQMHQAYLDSCELAVVFVEAPTGNGVYSLNEVTRIKED